MNSRFSMQTGRLSLITKWRLTVILVLALLPCIVVAEGTATLDEQLIEAAARGDVVLVQRLLDKGADVNARPRDGWTPLMSAASGRHWGIGRAYPGNFDRMSLWRAEPTSLSGRTDVTKLLLDKGGDVNAKDKEGRTALTEAAKIGHTDIVKLLLDKAADINTKDKDGRSPLVWAAAKMHADLVKLLVERGADVNAKDKGELTALCVTARFDRGDVFFLLEDQRGHVANPWDKDYRNGFTQAALQRRSDIAKFLIRSGANVTLTVAAMLGDKIEIQRLLAAGCDVNAKEADDGLTPLMGAAAQGHVDAARLLIEKGADVHATDSKGRAALTMAAGSGHADIVELLVDKGADVDGKDKGGETALMRAARRGHSLIVHLLLHSGADVNTKDNKWGWTALVWAARHEHTDVIELLLGKHADVNARDRYGKTALMHAAFFGRSDVVRLLILKGADVNVTTKTGETALTLAMMGRRVEVVELLKSAGAK